MGYLFQDPEQNFLKKSFSYSGAKLWNKIPEDIRNSSSYNLFCQNLSSSASQLLD